MDRRAESVALMTNGSTYMFDAGEPVGPTIITDAVNRFYGVERSDEQAARDRKMSVDIYSIRSVFISHLHADHTSGLPMLLQVADQWQKRDESFRFGHDNRLEVFVPKLGISILREYLEVIGLGQPRFDLSIKPVKAGEFYRDENLVVLGIHNSHRLGSSFSFLVHGGGRTVAYSGDIALKDLEQTDLLRDDVDLLVVECAHFSPESLFETLRGRSVGKVVVSHIHPGLYGEADEVEKLGRRFLGNKVHVARDGMEFEV